MYEDNPNVEGLVHFRRGMDKSTNKLVIPLPLKHNAIFLTAKLISYLERLKF